MIVFKQYATFSERADAAYVYLRSGEVVRTRALDERRNVDLDSDNNVIGIEFLGVSAGVNLHGVPEPATIKRLLSEHGLRYFESVPV
jgi:uncharacterized protein YuzE